MKNTIQSDREKHEKAVKAVATKKDLNSIADLVPDHLEDGEATGEAIPDAFEGSSNTRTLDCAFEVTPSHAELNLPHENGKLIEIQE